MATGPNQPRRSVSLEKDPAYWQALGEFVEAFSGAEVALFHYVAFCAEISTPVARALFSGFHSDQMADKIRRIWQVRSPNDDVRNELEDVFAQLKAIEGVRNSVVHYMSFVTDDKGRISSNITRALTPNHIKEHRVAPELLGKMSADLNKIGLHLASLNTFTGAPLADRAKQSPALAAAWQYKPPQDHQN